MLMTVISSYQGPGSQMEEHCEFAKRVWGRVPAKNKFGTEQVESNIFMNDYSGSNDCDSVNHLNIKQFSKLLTLTD